MPTSTAPVTDVRKPSLPSPRGPLSETVNDVLRHRSPAGPTPMVEAGRVDPFGEDLAVALHTCYELHYRGLHGVDDGWEWDPELLRLRSSMERLLLEALESAVAGGDDVNSTIDTLLVEPVPGRGVAHHLAEHGEWWQLREYIAQRSIYHLKEADPQSWVIPRLQGRAKAALVAVQFDEYGGGRADRLHAHLFGEMMVALGLSADYLHYADHVAAPALNLVNVMSMFGLHRRWRGALVGQFALVEITSSPGSARMVRALERMGASPSTAEFYREHVEADAVHEQLLRRDVVGGLLEDEPELAADVVFGVQASELLEEQLSQHTLNAWSQGASSLRRPLPAHPGPA